MFRDNISGDRNEFRYDFCVRRKRNPILEFLRQLEYKSIPVHNIYASNSFKWFAVRCTQDIKTSCDTLPFALCVRFPLGLIIYQTFDQSTYPTSERQLGFIQTSILRLAPLLLTTIVNLAVFWAHLGHRAFPPLFFIVVIK